jgi:inhibitor of KinA
LSAFHLTYKPFGNSAILIEWPAKIAEEIIGDIVTFEKKIIKNSNVLDTVVAYHSLLIKYTAPVANYTSTTLELQELYTTQSSQKKEVQQLWQIPVCYHPSFGLDLEEMAAKKHCTVEDIIALHTGVSYLIYFIGFLPGFLYLGGLHATLHTPRIATPRIRVAKGSVGIGGAQTGVYPQNSSGGWNIIGKSPVNFFNTNNVAPIFAKPGDRIQFIPITLATFYEVEKEVANKTYTLKSSLL